MCIRDSFKSVIFASGLELKLYDMFKDTYDDKGYEMVGGARIKSWKAGGHGHQTFLQVLENSSNPGFVEISRRMGLDREYELSLIHIFIIDLWCSGRT